MSAVIDLEDVTIAYDRHPAVHHLSGSFQEGSLTALIGPNGAGKSSLLRAIAGLVRLQEGHIAFHHGKRADIGYLPQASAIDQTFPISVWDVVALGLWRRIGAFGGIDKAMAAEIATAMAAVGLRGMEKRPFGDLSAGQRQRVLFARLMVADSRLILLDEPFSAMDEGTIEDLLALIARWRAEGRTQIVVLHDIDTVRRHFPETLLLAREAVAWGATEGVLNPANLKRAKGMRSWGDEHDICQGAA